MLERVPAVACPRVASFYPPSIMPHVRGIQLLDGTDRGGRFLCSHHRMRVTSIGPHTGATVTWAAANLAGGGAKPTLGDTFSFVDGFRSFDRRSKRLLAANFNNAGGVSTKASSHTRAAFDGHRPLPACPPASLTAYPSIPSGICTPDSSLARFRLPHEAALRAICRKSGTRVLRYPGEAWPA